MRKIVLTLITILLIISCKKESTKVTYYKTKPNGKILNQSEFDSFKKNLSKKMNKIVDSTGTVEINYILKDSVITNDSIIKTYTPNVKMFFPDSNEDSNIESEKIYSFLNKKLPSETLFTRENNKINLNKLTGKPTLLNFWFAACKPCIDEMPVLNNLKKKYGEKVNFISVTFENKKVVDNFMKKHKFDFNNVIGAKDYLDKLGIEVFPLNIFINKNGIVKRIEHGIPYNSENNVMKIGDGKTFEKYIEELL